MEGIPCLLLWDEIVRTLGTRVSDRKHRHPRGRKTPHSVVPRERSIYSELLDVDHVPCTLPLSGGISELLVLEDNDGVIKMCQKGRSMNMRHVLRTHRVD